MRYPRDLTGLQFGMLVLRKVSGGKNSRWECLCKCGRKTIIGRPDVFIAKSCGCARYDSIITHGMSNTPTHKSWLMMRNRCLNPKADCYENYGGRGIKVCKRWDKFENFLEDMKTRPSMQHSLERLNNNGDYEPSNCKWATKTEQNRNKRNNRILSAFDKTMCLKDWALEYKIPTMTLFYRLKTGMSLEAALTKESNLNSVEL